jgi:hypothetical protein
MKRNFERQRDKEYASHVCAEHPRPSSPQDRSELSRPRGARPCSPNPSNRAGQTDLRRAI